MVRSLKIRQKFVDIHALKKNREKGISSIGLKSLMVQNNKIKCKDSLWSTRPHRALKISKKE
jgi:hypothetical protein